MSIVDKIELLDRRMDQNPLVEALDMYHSLIDAKIIKPRENQLNKSGINPQIMQFNTNKGRLNDKAD